MRFLNYWPLLLVILVPIIIIMYLLKQKAAEHPFSSVYLWRELYRNHESDTPWEKLKRSLLMVIQIFTLLVLILTMCAPYLLKGGHKAGSVIVVIDNSASMGTMYDEKNTRLEEAKKQAVDYLNSQSDESSFTVISSASGDAIILLSNAKDKDEAIKKVKGIEETTLGGNMTNSVNMVRTLQLQLDTDSEAVFFTDNNMALPDISGYVVNLYTEQENAYIDYVSYGYQGDNLTVLAKVTNKGSMTLDTDINLYGDDSMMAVSHVVIPAGQSEVVYFEGMHFDGKVLKAEINDSDALNADNVCREVVVKNDKEAKVLLVTKQNLYLEKAMELVDGVQVTKTADVNDLDTFVGEDFDLYVFDSMKPDQLPPSGNIVFFNVPLDDITPSTYHDSGMIVEAEEEVLTKYMEDASFGVSCGYTYETPSFATSFLTTSSYEGEGTHECVGFYGVYGSQKLAVYGFDVHNSQLPLTIEFPIMIHNLLGENISTGMLNNTKVDCGSSIKISGAYDGGDIVVAKPDEEEVTFKTPLVSFIDTNQMGEYTVSQNTKDGTNEETFVANFPGTESSMVQKTADEVAAAGGNTKVNKTVDTILNLKNYILILVLILLGLEWIIYVKES